MIDKIQYIAFDADDTLWNNEPFFRTTEEQFVQLMHAYGEPEEIKSKLFETEIANIPLYGFGIKGFILSMLETASQLAGSDLSKKMVQEIIAFGKEMLTMPVEVLPGVREVLKTVSNRYRLILATKGDLLDQERKLEKSGLLPYFHHIEVMSDKKRANYQALLKHLDCSPDNFLMIGNSLKSDIQPVLELGAHAYHIPHHTTWQHEELDKPLTHPRLKSFQSIEEILPLLID
ncbi:MAG: HAD family hydrolase [Bacteroidota bacterium]